MNDVADQRRLLERALDRLEPLTDRFNPILVKEVRQFLRARGFAWSYFALVALAAIIGAFIVLDDESSPSQELGQGFLMLLQVLLAVGVMIVVPLQSFQSLGAEWEGETYDQLALSGLKPQQIVSGKFGSAFVQSLLMTAAFAPFVALAFLMRGVDLLAMFVVLANLVIHSLWASALALALSSLSAQRVVRVVLFLVLAVLLTFGLSSTIQFGWFVIEDPAMLRDGNFMASVISGFLVGSTLAAFCHLFASGRLAHSEENAVTPLRLLVVFSTVGVMAWLVLAKELGYLSPSDVDSTFAMLVTLGAFAAVLWSTERERLGRRVAHEVSLRRGAARRLPSALLPGGGRGMLFGLAHVAVIAFMLAAVNERFNWRFDSPAWFGVWMLCYMAFFVGLPSALLARLCVRELGQWATRFSVAVFVAAATLVPAILGLMLGNHELTNLQHPFNPFWVLAEASNGNVSFQHATIVLGLGALGLVVNTPRIVRGLREVGRARRGRYEELDPAVVRSRERAFRTDGAQQT